MVRTNFPSSKIQSVGRIVAYIDLALVILSFITAILAIILIFTVFEEKVENHKIWINALEKNATNTEYNDLHFNAFYTSIAIIFIVALGIHLILALLLMKGVQETNLTFCRIWFFSHVTLFIAFLLSGIFYGFISLYILIPYTFLAIYRAFTLFIIYNFIRSIDAGY